LSGISVAAGVCTHLTTLKLDDVVTAAAVSGMLARGADAPAFPTLRKADVVVEVAAATALCAIVLLAEELVLHVAGSGRTGLLIAATLMPRLRVLRVSSCCELQAAAHASDAARSHSALEHVCLAAARFRISFKGLRLFLARLPHARVLQLSRMRQRTPNKSLCLAGNSCPQLRRVQVQECFYPLLLGQSVDQNVVFPKLETLVVASLNMDGAIHMYEHLFSLSARDCSRADGKW
jgi:hypothetical protein